MNLSILQNFAGRRLLVLAALFLAACSHQRASQEEQSAPEPITVLQPVIPDVACEQNISGWVHVSFMVTEGGTVEDAQVIASKPRKLFDAAALESVSRLIYDRGYRPQAVRQRIVFDPARMCGSR